MVVAIFPVSTGNPLTGVVAVPGTTLASVRDGRDSGWVIIVAVPTVTRVERGETTMRKLTAGAVGLAVLVLGAGLAPSSALAKCPKDCKQQLRTEFKACKSACGKHDGTCKQACRTAAKAARTTCKQAANPTPLSCSPSGAFLL
jgi:hypothetical protein